VWLFVCPVSESHGARNRHMPDRPCVRLRILGRDYEMSARWQHNGAGTGHRASRSVRPPILSAGTLTVIAAVSGIVAHMWGVI
jgi:hypothetical protein